MSEKPGYSLCEDCDKILVCNLCGCCLECEGCQCCSKCKKHRRGCHKCGQCYVCGHSSGCDSGEMNGPGNHKTDEETQAESSKSPEETEGEERLRTGHVFTSPLIDLGFTVEFTGEELASIHSSINLDRETAVIDRRLLEMLLAGYTQLLKRSAGYERAIAKVFSEQNR